MHEDQDAVFPDETRVAGGNVVLAGRYRVIRELGRGAMGTVYLAEDQALDGLQVALKMPPAVLARNPRALEALKQEALLARQLSHPNIVTLRSFESTKDGMFLVMDYVKGQTLEAALAKSGAVSEDFMEEVFRPIAAALDYAHGEGVIHRDVKPGNIMIREDGRPLLADFGIARQMMDTMTRMTGLASSGTLPYMSPEQLRGHAPAAAQDIYSLAATMYECIAGQPPFHRGEIAFQIATVEPPPPTRAPSPLVGTIMRGLSKDPSARPKTCRDLVWARRQRRRSRSHRLVGVWAALLLVGVAVAVAMWQMGGDGGADLKKTPSSGLVSPVRALRARVTQPRAGRHLSSRTVKVQGEVEGEARSVLVNGQSVRVAGGVLSAKVFASEDGPFEIRVMSVVGKTLAEKTVVVDTTAPVIEILSPTSRHLITREQQVEVTGSVRDANLVWLRVNGEAITPGTEGAFRWTATLTPGEEMALKFTAVDRAGNEAAEVTRRLTREETPTPEPGPKPAPAPARPTIRHAEVRLLEPKSGLWARDRTLVVRGTVTGPAVTLRVNGAVVSVSGGAFGTAVRAHGDGPLTIRVTDTAGSVLAERTVQVDSKRPVITIRKPRKSRTVTLDSVLHVEGHVEEANLAYLRVNGKPLTPEVGGAFSWPVAAKPGEEVALRFEAADQAGNEAVMVSLTVVFEKAKAAWESWLASAVVAGKRKDWREARKHLADVPKERVPDWLASSIQDWESKPILVVKSPRDGAKLRSTHFHLEGTLRTKRKGDELYVNGTRVKTTGDKWLIGLDGKPGGTMLVRVQVKDGGELRTEQSLRVSFSKPAPPTPSWAKVSERQIAAARDHGVPAAFENGIGMRFVLIPAGSFRMGSPSSEASRGSNETLHVVKLTKPFYMQTTEVSNAQYRVLVPGHSSGEYRHNSLNQGDQPVVKVTWNDVSTFAQNLSSGDSKRRYRLPTEAEWEYACRAGKGTRYWWGNDVHSGHRYANANDRHTDHSLHLHTGHFAQDDGYRVTAPVGSFSANPWGLYCVSGNANEWCADWYASIGSGSVANPMGPSRSAAPLLRAGSSSTGRHHRGHKHRGTTSGRAKVIRGGGWIHDPNLSLRSAARMWGHPNLKWGSVGFRLVVPVD